MTRVGPRLALALGLPAALLVLTPPAGAASRIGPQQYFTGVVNGTAGNTIAPIPVDVGCFGPVTPGETGHPLAGQTLAVHQLFPPTATASLGRTGNDSVVDAFFGAPPPGVAGAGTASRSRARSLSFTRYDKVRGIPASLTLPCSGTGTVWFVPVPVTPPSQAQAVPVRFESQP